MSFEYTVHVHAKRTERSVVQSSLPLSEARVKFYEECKGFPATVWASMTFQSRIDSRKSIALFDMDSTLVCEEGVDELARAYGVYEKVSAITKTAMEGGLPFEDSLKQRIQCLRGMTRTQVESVAKKIKLSPGAKTLYAKLIHAGFSVGMVSGGFDELTQNIREAMPDLHITINRLKFDETGALTGEVLEPIVGAQTKVETLEKLARAHRKNLSETIAFGDGANDLPMLQHAGFSLGYHPKSVLYPACDLVIFSGPLIAPLVKEIK